MPGATHSLTAGQLLVLDASIPYEVAALDDATFLLTLTPDVFVEA